MTDEEIKALVEKQLGCSVVDFEVECIEGVDTAYFNIPIVKRMRLHIPPRYIVVFISTINNEVEAYVSVSDILSNE